MDYKMMQIGVADALLDTGIAIDLWRVKLWRGKQWRLRFVMRRPCLGSQIRATRLWLTLGTNVEQFNGMTAEERLVFFALHAKTLTMIVALAICRGYLSGKYLAPIVAWLLRWRTKEEVWMTCAIAYMSMITTSPFEIIIRSLQASNLLMPRLSQQAMGS